MSEETEFREYLKKKSKAILDSQDSSYLDIIKAKNYLSQIKEYEENPPKQPEKNEVKKNKHYSKRDIKFFRLRNKIENEMENKILNRKN